MVLPIFDENDWKSYEFNVHPEDRDRFLVDTIKPIVDALEEDGCLNSFHFIRSRRDGGVTLRINADTHVAAVINEHTDQDPSEVSSQSWHKNDLAAGEYGARILIKERERLSRRALEVLEAKQAGNDVDVQKFMARQAHLSTNMHGTYLNFNSLINNEENMPDGMFQLFPERR